MTSDVLVLGAGPAGIEAALASAAGGASVVLLDNASAAGGQVYRATPAEFADGARAHDEDHALGDALRTRLAASRVLAMWEQTVWLAEPGFTVESIGPDGRRTFRADAVIVASGTHERIIPVPGWTLPGVVGLGAVTVLLKSQRVLPGTRTLVAGCGPLLLAAAAGILEAGGEVSAVVDLNGWIDVLRVAPQMLARPDLVARGSRWLRLLRRMRVPIFQRHAVIAIEGETEVSGAVIVPVDATWKPIPGGRQQRIAADAVAIGHGLVPAVEATRLLGAEHTFEPSSGGWVPRHDEFGRTTVPRLYVAGDVCGVAGAEAALGRGRRAGRIAACDLGKSDASTFSAGMRADAQALRRAERFGSAAAALMRTRSGLTDTITSDTIVCRCEDVTRREIDAAVADGARSLNAVKAATRCGMGPCQGRMCGEAVALLLAGRGGGRSAVGAWTTRPPLRPVPLDALTGAFDYADIPLQSTLPT
jgi:thioredoxin reductase/bacterioferritin-associated ferredoxin